MKKISIYGMCLVIIFAASEAFGSYRSELKRWTKSAKVYDLETMDATLVWNATILSKEMLLAQSQLEQKRLKTATSVILEGEGVRFFIGLYTRSDLKDFSLADDSVWKIFFVGEDGSELKPTTIEPVNITIMEKTFYPYLTRWSKAYIVKFPETALGKHPKLILRSIVAESILEWRL